MAMADSTRPSESSPEDIATLLRKQRKKQYDRERYLRNKVAICQKTKEYREANADKLREAYRLAYAANADERRKKNRATAKRNRAKNTAREREWRRLNKDKVRGYYLKHVSKKRKSDVCFRLQQTVRSRVHGALARALIKKNDRTLSYVGCTGSELRDWLEAKFLPGMTWDNHGRHGWHIDHIIPLAKFDLKDPEQQAAAFHYTNLQPLWAKDNLTKSHKVEGQNLFGFAYAARIADKASATPKKRRKRGW
jgi:hypothetical protein